MEADFEGAALLGDEADGGVAALWARKATSRFARNGLLLGMLSRGGGGGGGGGVCERGGSG